MTVDELVLYTRSEIPKRLTITNCQRRQGDSETSGRQSAQDGLRTLKDNNW